LVLTARTTILNRAKGGRRAAHRRPAGLCCTARNAPTTCRAPAQSDLISAPRLIIAEETIGAHIEGGSARVYLAVYRLINVPGIAGIHGTRTGVTRILIQARPCPETLGHAALLAFGAESPASVLRPPSPAGRLASRMPAPLSADSRFRRPGQITTPQIRTVLAWRAPELWVGQMLEVVNT
jgi:hypothetical protein